MQLTPEQDLCLAIILQALNDLNASFKYEHEVRRWINRMSKSFRFCAVGLGIEPMILKTRLLQIIKTEHLKIRHQYICKRKSKN